MLPQGERISIAEAKLRRDTTGADGLIHHKSDLGPEHGREGTLQAWFPEGSPVGCCPSISLEQGNMFALVSVFIREPALCSATLSAWSNVQSE